MNTCYLSLGSNQKFPARQIAQALQHLKRMPSTYLIKVSTPYWNAAWGEVKQQQFCNVVVAIETRLPPTLLLQHCQAIEKKQGRVRKKKYGPRTLDIDILYYGERKINTQQLTVPHPLISVRDYVLIPLLEITSKALAKRMLGSDEPQ